MAYVPGTTMTNVTNPIDWITRDGKSSSLRAARSEWGNPRFSPDGQRIAMDISDGKQRDIWVYDWARDTLTQLTFDAGSDTVPVWTPDGKRLAFTSDMVKPGAAVVGAGTSWSGKKLMSDVDEAVADVAGWITPRIGGVGPMTRAMLLRNAVLAAEKVR